MLQLKFPEIIRVVAEYLIPLAVKEKLPSYHQLQQLSLKCVLDEQQAPSCFRTRVKETCFLNEHKVGEMRDNYVSKPRESYQNFVCHWWDEGAGHIILLKKTGNSWVVLQLLHPSCLLWQSQIHSEKVVNSLRVLCSRFCYKGVLLLLGRFTWNKLLQETTDEAVTNILAPWLPGIEYSIPMKVSPMEQETDPKKSRKTPEVSLSILKNLSSLGRELKHCYLHNGAGDASDVDELLRESHLLWTKLISQKLHNLIQK